MIPREQKGIRKNTTRRRSSKQKRQRQPWSQKAQNIVAAVATTCFFISIGVLGIDILLTIPITIAVFGPAMVGLLGVLVCTSFMLSLTRHGHHEWMSFLSRWKIYAFDRTVWKRALWATAVHGVGLAIIGFAILFLMVNPILHPTIHSSDGVDNNLEEAHIVQQLQGATNEIFRTHTSIAIIQVAITCILYVIEHTAIFHVKR